MTTITVTLTTTPTQFPGGTGTTGIAIAVTGLTPVILTAAPYVAVFENAPSGTYTAVAQALDANRSPLGNAVTSSSFVVAAADVTIDMPLSLSVSVQ